ncbi:Synaptogyrin-1,Putative synaptogyrin-2 like protein,Synaptogyrin-3,Synaptogyrin-2 [Acanthosepion pharaonis]|uniref:Synaptogyrin n=1 Tax=Acanthosepion pharaonis TaxID=158019 RepID=A0A812C2E5_ACAPH|nr:Synaptogyrin-1,Putative synaptogyrin-2 like protein,Synaptogyrin-3,Synaptogyrin-2 [Sepia pharaonis]
MSSGGAYGAGKAGVSFDPLVFFQRPQVIIRIISWLFAIVVFGCISSGGWFSEQCQFNDDANACRFGSAIGVLAFLGCILFLIIDAIFDNISSVQHRKYAVLGDLGFSGGWTFMWFVCFCYLADSWRKTKQIGPKNHGKDDIQAAIAFSFFSILSFGVLTFLAVQKYRMGASDAFTTGYEPEPNASSPYSSFPGSETGDPYQQPPFSTQKEAPDFQAPTY